MGVIYQNSIVEASKRIPLRHNVSINVIDLSTRKIVARHTGHNAATNGLLTGIGHYLTGDGILNQGWDMLKGYVPQYISLGTMGLTSQEADSTGRPLGIGSTTGTEVDRYTTYMRQVPGYGSDGYDPNLMNGRRYAGLGLTFDKRPYTDTIECELITDNYLRSAISFRDVVPEVESELPQTIDVVFSALIPLANLAKFRPDGKDYVFITEAGLWSRKDWVNGGDNGLLAGYRIAPPDESNWDMTKAENRQILRNQILKVGKNQVVQVIWKIQLGALQQLNPTSSLVPGDDSRLRWTGWEK